MKKRIVTMILVFFMMATVAAVPSSAIDNKAVANTEPEYTWSPWSTERPAQGMEYQTKTQYSCSNKSAPVYSGYSSLSGYNLEAKVLYGTSYGKWQLVSPKTGVSSDSSYRTEITRQSKTAQFSYCYVCPCKKWYHSNKYGKHGNSCRTSNILKVYHSVSLPNSGYYTDGDGYRTNVGTNTLYAGKKYKLGTVYLMSYNGKLISKFSSNSPKKVIWLWQSSQKTKTMYRTVTKKYRYKYWKWESWSSWSDSYIASSSTRKVKSRVLYRYKIYPEEQSITGEDIFNKTYSKSTFDLGATAKTKLSYSSNNTNVAEVSANGTVTLKGAGTATITIKAASSPYYKSAVKTVVINVKRANQTIKCKYGSQIEKYCSKTTFNLKASAGTRLSYSSSDKNIATVNSAGDIKVRNPGTVRITISAVQTSKYYGKSKTITIKALMKKPVLQVSKGTKKGQIEMKWNMVYGADEYIIYRYSSGNGYAPKWKIKKTSVSNQYQTQKRKYSSKKKKYYWGNVKTISGQQTSRGLPTIVEKNLKRGKKYSYKVKAIDTYSGTSRISNRASAEAK